MSSSFRKRRAVAGVAAALGATAAGAAEFSYQPIVSLSSAYNTNIDLDPVTKTGAEGYFADAATNIDIATRTSETFFQPRLLYNYYPSASYRNRLEGFLNMNSRYTGQRDSFSITGFFDHRDDVNAEQVGATVNPVNPEVGTTTPNSGVITQGVTRNYVILDPTYTHSVTPLSGVGAALEYQRMFYSPADNSAHIPFSYYQGRLFYSRAIDQRTDMQFGVLGSRYQAETIDPRTTAEGVQINGGHSWTQVLRTTLTAQYQHVKFEETNPQVIDRNTNAWAATLATTYTEQVSRYRVSLGRTLFPSSAGGLFTTDQLQAQYTRDFTPRLQFTTGIRLFRDRTTLGVSRVNTRTYLTGTLSMEYMITQTIFTAASYSYIRQKYEFDPAAAQANVASIMFGYRGLQRQR